MNVARAVWFAVKDEATGRMMLLSGKNNLSRDVGGLAYEIEEVDKAKSIKAPLLRSRGIFGARRISLGKPKIFRLGDGQQCPKNFSRTKSVRFRRFGSNVPAIKVGLNN